MLDKCDNVAISGVLWSVDEMVMWIDFFSFWGTVLRCEEPRTVCWQRNLVLSVWARASARRRTFTKLLQLGESLHSFFVMYTLTGFVNLNLQFEIGYRSLWRGKHENVGVAIRINSGNFKINVPWSSPARWRVRFTRKELLLNQNISYK